jgi:glycosyltransferase involved in cell wall biosynthesis
MPKVTVLMSVYNGQQYLREAIESILSQTFKDFEFLIIDDHSADESVSIIESYGDKRIRLIKNDKNLGLAASLNKGISLAKGEYIARMDHDDISLPNRLEEQVRYMDEHFEIGVCGAWFVFCGDTLSVVVRHPTEHAEIKAELFWRNVIAHPTVMMRKSVFLENGLLYNESFDKAQDYDLWVRAAQKIQLANIPQVLLRYRVHSESGSVAYTEVSKFATLRTREMQVPFLGIVPSDEERMLHGTIYLPEGYTLETFLHAQEAWLTRILEANRETKYYEARYFEPLIGKRWFMVCAANGNKGFGAWKMFWRSELRRTLSLKKDIRFMVQFLIKTIIRKRTIF